CSSKPDSFVPRPSGAALVRPATRLAVRVPFQLGRDQSLRIARARARCFALPPLIPPAPQRVFGWPAGTLPRCPHEREQFPHAPAAAAHACWPALLRVHPDPRVGAPAPARPNVVLA